MWILSLLKPDPPAASHFMPGKIHHAPAACALFEEGDAFALELVRSPASPLPATAQG